MGDYFKSIVRIDELTTLQRESLVADVTAWVEGAGFLVPAVSAPHAQGGWAAGPQWHSMLDEEPGSPFDRLDASRSGSVDIDSTRQLRDAGQWWGSPYSCVSCGHSMATDALDELISVWADQPEPIARCMQCGQSSLLSDWRCENPTVLVGGPSITFWGWPELNDKMMASLARQLGGRTRWIYGKI